MTALYGADVAFVIVGGMAAVAQGSSLLTADLDICYQRNPANYERISLALRQFNPRLRGAPSGLPFVLDSLVTDAGDLDLLGEVAGLGN
jgi:hypothetical protein